MASVNVTVDISETALKEAVDSAAGTRAALNDEASRIAASANGMASERSCIWYVTGKPHTPGRSGGKFHKRDNITEQIGDKEARYSAKPARRFPSGTLAIVYTANYAAQKDNSKNNTLLKAKG